MFDTETRLGFGTCTLTDRSGTKTIEAASDTGYRHVDTARLYGNEREVGDAIAASGVNRVDLLVATKVAHFEEPEKTGAYVERAVSESFDRLDIDRIDLLYHHWPRSQDDSETVLPVLANEVANGAVANLGVSNYIIDDMELVRDLVDVSVSALQVEMHPLLPQNRTPRISHGRGD